MLWLAGSGRRSAWIVGLAVQTLWVAYGMLSHQWGFIASACAYAIVIGRNLARWKPAEESTDLRAQR